MWIVKCGKLVSSNKIELTYIRKDQLISLNTEGICQSIELFCPDTVQISKSPRQKLSTINTKDWVLNIIKLDGVAKTLSKPIILGNMNTVEELYHQINQSDREAPNCNTINHTTKTIDSAHKFNNNNSFLSLDSNYSAECAESNHS
jgi:hypothetical protein